MTIIGRFLYFSTFKNCSRSLSLSANARVRSIRVCGWPKFVFLFLTRWAASAVRSITTFETGAATAVKNHFSRFGHSILSSFRVFPPALNDPPVFFQFLNLFNYCRSGSRSSFPASFVPPSFTAARLFNPINNSDRVFPHPIIRQGSSSWTSKKMKPSGFLFETDQVTKTKRKLRSAIDRCGSLSLDMEKSIKTLLLLLV